MYTPGAYLYAGQTRPPQDMGIQNVNPDPRQAAARMYADAELGTKPLIWLIPFTDIIAAPAIVNLSVRKKYGVWLVLPGIADEPGILPGPLSAFPLPARFAKGSLAIRQSRQSGQSEASIGWVTTDGSQSRAC